MIAPKGNPSQDDGMQPHEIITAAMENNNQVVASLLETGVDINTTFQGYTPLHIACMHGNASLVEILLRHGETKQAINFSLVTDERQFVAWQLALDNHFFDLGLRVLKAEPRRSRPKLTLVP